MDSFTACNEILKNLQSKYRHIDNIMNLTKDLERAMMTGDAESFGTILEMRGDAMVLADKLDKSNREIWGRLPEPLKTRIGGILYPKQMGAGGAAMTLDNPLETNIYDTNKRIGNLLSKVVKLDTEISNKVQGQQAGRQGPGIGEIRA